MLRISVTDYHHFTFSLYDLAFIANGFNRRSYFHDANLLNLLLAPYYTAAAQIVRRQFHRYVVALDNFDVVRSEFAGNMGNDNVAVFHGNPEYAVRKYFLNHTFYFNYVFFF